MLSNSCGRVVIDFDLLLPAANTAQTYLFWASWSKTLHVFDVVLSEDKSNSAPNDTKLSHRANSDIVINPAR